MIMITYAAVMGVFLACLSVPRASAVGASEGPQTQPAPDEKAIRSIADLDGNWSGEKEGVKVELQFDSVARVFHAQWTLTYTVRRDPPPPQEPPRFEVRKSADLKCVVDPQTGRLKLLLPAYRGSDKAIKRSALNGKSPVGDIAQTSDGTLRLRVISTGYNHPETADYDLPAVEGVLLHRTASTVD